MLLFEGSWTHPHQLSWSRFQTETLHKQMRCVIVIINCSYKAHYTQSPNALYKVNIEHKHKLRVRMTSLLNYYYYYYYVVCMEYRQTWE